MAEVMECIREDSQVLDILSGFYLLLTISPHTLPPHSLTEISGRCSPSLRANGVHWILPPMKALGRFLYPVMKMTSLHGSCVLLMCFHTAPVLRSCWRDPCWLEGPPTPCLVWCQLLLLPMHSCWCWCVATFCSSGSGCFLI